MRTYEPAPRRARGRRVLAALLLPLASACTSEAPPGDGDGDAAQTSRFDDIVKLLRRHADAYVFESEEGSRVVVSPRLQGRILTASVGAVASTGYVNDAAIREGEKDVAFNNFGGLDRFWISPEAGQYGVYFEPGVEMTRERWQVPASFDRGPFELIAKTDTQVNLARDVEVRNYLGETFSTRIQRELGLVTRKEAEATFGTAIPSGVSYVGCYSMNVMTNSGDAAWDPEKGLIGIWIAGMLAAGDRAVVIAPIRSGPESELGPEFNDDYFGVISEETPDRIALATFDLDTGKTQAVLYRGDAKRVGKFGLSQERTTGVAGAYDFDRNLLTVVRFDMPEPGDEPERYGNSTWVKDQPEPYGGDPFQSFNNGADGNSGARADAAFFELESNSPVRPLGPGESVSHRHETHHFQGDRAFLEMLAPHLLGVDLATVEELMKL